MPGMPTTLSLCAGLAACLAVAYLQMDTAGSCTTLEVTGTDVRLCRGEDGTVSATVSDAHDTSAAKAVGAAHARDRWTQLMVLRVVVQGRSAEMLRDVRDGFMRDVMFRGLRLYRQAEEVVAAASPAALTHLQAYADGFNAYCESAWWDGRTLEGILLKLPAERWTAVDSLALMQAFSYTGLGEQGFHWEKLNLNMAKAAVTPQLWARLKSWMRLSDDAGLYDGYVQAVANTTVWWPSVASRGAYLETPPASNCWAVDGQHTASRKPMFACDPHMPINRLPSFFYGMVVSTPEPSGGLSSSFGVTVPGFHLALYARSKTLAYGLTVSYFDAMDMFVEEVRDGKYRVDAANGSTTWHPLTVTTEVVYRRRFNLRANVSFWRTRHGTLEGLDPTSRKPPADGMFMARRMPGEGDFGVSMAALDALNVPWPSTNVSAAAAVLRRLPLAGNWVLADTRHVAYQASGLVPVRQPGVSGSLPALGWHPRFQHRGWVPAANLSHAVVTGAGWGCDLPGSVVSANNWEATPNVSVPIQNVCPGNARLRRACALLMDGTSGGRRLRTTDFQAMQGDVLSLPACEIMDLVRGWVRQRTAVGALLHDWDCRFEVESRGATAFDMLRRHLLRGVLSGFMLGEAVDTVWDGTHGFTGELFHELLLGRVNASLWFPDGDVGAVLRPAVKSFLRQTASLGVEDVPGWGASRAFTTHNLVAHGVPGLSVGPQPLPGSAFTLSQGTAVGDTVTGPAYQLVTDMGEDVVWRASPGGVSGRLFSGWYTAWEGYAQSTIG